MPKITKNKLFLLLCIVCGCSVQTPSYIGEQYLGAKYQMNSLGEEIMPDKDPLIRFDAFDCTTFVETSLANGKLKKLNKIRYKNAKVNVVYRNHFIETDWLRNNEDIVENASGLYGKTTFRHVVIDKKSWFKHVYNMDTDFKKQVVNIKYIPYENLVKFDIQSPLIVLFIHDGNGFEKKIGTDLAVVHMGFLLPNGIFRHASREYGRVMDVDFWDYINKRKRNKHNLGIALVKIK